MKKTILAVLVVSHLTVYSQEIEWRVEDNRTVVGERVIMEVDAGSVGLYDGISIVGEVIDNNGNWGFVMPTKANFSCFIRFSQGMDYQISQDVKTSNITLRMRKLSDSKMRLTANLPYVYKGARVLYRIAEQNGVTATAMSPAEIDSSGELVVSAPDYESLYTGYMGIGTGIPDANLHVKRSDANKNVAFLSEVSYHEDWNFGIISAVDRDKTKAFSVYRKISEDNYEGTFTVLGDGGVYAKELTINTPIFADYVFEKDYPLMPLSELENYIETYKHLPNMPGEEEVLKTGMQIGALQILQTEKLEELTLYTIQQEKRIEALEKLFEKKIDKMIKKKVTKMIEEKMDEENN